MRDAEADGTHLGPGRRGRRLRAALLLAPFAAAVWLGCSVQENYEVLSFFFDGVPDPSAPIGAGSGTGGTRLPGVTYYTHEPFVEGECMACHRSPSDFQMSWEDSSMCLDCHADAKEGYAYVHGPVAADACLWCHAPHESTVQPLLRVESPELCLQCHGLEMQDEPRIPEHEDLSRDCSDCHYAHGDDDRFFVKEPAEREADEAAPTEEAQAAAPAGAQDEPEETSAPEQESDEPTG